MVSYLVSKYKIASCIPLYQGRIVNGPIFIRLVDLVIVDFAPERHRPAIVFQLWVVRHVKEYAWINLQRVEDSLKSGRIFLAGGRYLQIEARFVLVCVSLRDDTSQEPCPRTQNSK